MVKILVTGGAGFIGSNLAGDLCRKEDVVVLDDLSTASDISKKFVEDLNVNFIKGSVNDQDLLKEILADVDYVLHQAAIPSVPRSIEDPLRTNHANAGGTLTLLKACVDSGVKKVVYASSSSIYGDTQTLPKVETMEPNPKSPYAVSKFVGEHYMGVFSEVYDLKTASLRYFNVYGPRQNPSPTIHEYAAVMPKFIYAALQDKPLEVYGDGTQTRDFTFVKDVVEANKKAMFSGEGIYNIAGGKQITINDLAKLIIDTIGSTSEIIHSSSRKGDVKHSLADISKAKRDLGWEPEYSLEEGLKVYLHSVEK